MFGDLFGNVQEKQEALQQKLSTILVEAEAGDGAIKVTATATQEITNISIDKAELDWEDTEQLEDLLMVAINRVLEKAALKAQEESQQMIQDMMPPGLGGLGNLLG